MIKRFFLYILFAAVPIVGAQQSMQSRCGILRAEGTSKVGPWIRFETWEKTIKRYVIFYSKTNEYHGFREDVTLTPTITLPESNPSEFYHALEYGWKTCKDTK